MKPYRKKKFDERVAQHAPRQITLEGQIKLEPFGHNFLGLFKAQWTEKGKKIVRQNPQLKQLFKFFRDDNLYWDPKQLESESKVEVSGGKAAVRRIAGWNAFIPGQDTTRLGAFSIELPNGKKFVIKAGLRPSSAEGNEIRAAHVARKIGLSTVEHYVRLDPLFPEIAPRVSPAPYFLLTAHEDLSTYSDYPRPVPENLRKQFFRESKLLYEHGISDAVHKNCFVEELRNGKYKLHWFDLRWWPKTTEKIRRENAAWKNLKK